MDQLLRNLPQIKKHKKKELWSVRVAFSFVCARERKSCEQTRLWSEKNEKKEAKNRKKKNSSGAIESLSDKRLKLLN